MISLANNWVWLTDYSNNKVFIAEYKTDKSIDVTDKTIIYPRSNNALLFQNLESGDPQKIKTCV